MSENLTNSVIFSYYVLSTAYVDTCDSKRSVSQSSIFDRLWM